MSSEPLFVARPIVPDPKKLSELLDTAFRTRRLTNAGPLTNMLELRLAELLQIPHVAVMSNGTIAIEIAARALNMHGKVITTPFTFPATVTALLWMGLEPILVDIEEDFLTIDPDCIENALAEDVTGIVGVHIYGNPCDIGRIRNLSKKSGVPVLYDGAHAFNGTIDGEPIAAAGDATTLSFHATKIFNTAEGGAIVTTRDEIKQRADLLRNFGIAAEDHIVDVGINGKMSEIHAALGLANLEKLAEEYHARVAIAAAYKDALSENPAIKVIEARPGVAPSYQYFVIRIRGPRESRLRDNVYSHLRQNGIFARRYFYPLLSEVPAIRNVLKQPDLKFPRAEQASREVLVLPMHGGMKMADAERVARHVIEVIDG